MEKVIFKKTGSIANFVEWVERFKGEISKDSLIIEIDSVSKMFVSKTFSGDKSLVRYSRISFADAGLELDESKFNADVFGGKRVLVGIFVILPKFIEVLKTFETAEKFTLEIETTESDVKEIGKQWCATSITLKTTKPKKLTMKIPGSSLNAVEMTPLSDETFDTKVWVAPNPISIKVSGDELKNLVSISEIFLHAEKLKNLIEFYTTTNEDGARVLMARDPSQGTYDRELGIIEDTSTMEKDISISIYRERFLLAVKNAFDETTISISTSNANRVLIQLGEGDTKTIIGRVNL